MNAPASSPYALPYAESKAMRHIISILLENEAGALSRVAGLFSARGYNIESLTVAPTEDRVAVAHDHRHHRLATTSSSRSPSSSTS